VEKEIRDVIYTSDLFDYPEGDDDMKFDEGGDYSGVESESYDKDSEAPSKMKNYKNSSSPI
jgi:hypothetical protein